MLVTGATGFVGTWLTKKLLDLGHDVRVLSRSGRVDFPFDFSRVEIFRGDVSDAESTLRAAQNVDSIFHLAGVVGYSRNLRQAMVSTNVVGTANIIDAAQNAKIKRLVYMSSVAAVGAGFDSHSILNEDSKFNLHQLNLGYFETKLRAEQLVIKATRDGLIDSVILNPSTIYGAGDAKKDSRSVQIKVAKGQFRFYPSGGVNVVHIQDVVDAVYRAWEIGQSGERYILAGENLLIRDLFKLIADEAGVPAPKLFLPKSLLLLIGRAGDQFEKFGHKPIMTSEKVWPSVLFNWFDNSKARRELNLNPRTAREAIRESVAWMKANGII